MKRGLFLVIFFLAICVGARAQPPIAEWAKVKEIRLLESTREHIMALFAAESFSSWRYEYSESFFAKDSVIKVSYSNGTCSGALQEWNVAEWVVTEIVVTPKSLIRVANVGIDVRSFLKERTDPQRKQIFTTMINPRAPQFLCSVIGLIPFTFFHQKRVTAVFAITSR